jgi:hypothetical protein
LRDVLGQARAGVLPGMERRGVTVEEEAGEYPRWLEVDRQRKPSTLQGYRSVWSAGRFAIQLSYSLTRDRQSPGRRPRRGRSSSRPRYIGLPAPWKERQPRRTPKPAALPQSRDRTRGGVVEQYYELLAVPVTEGELAAALGGPLLRR